MLRAAPFSQAGLRAWVLQRDGVLLASCETLCLPGPRRQGRSQPQPRTTRSSTGVGHGIASVYVDPQQRGHGYASELLQQVHAVRGEGAVLCFLWSEIGPTLYGRLGCVARPLSYRRYAAAPKEESHGATRRLAVPAPGGARCSALQQRKLDSRGLSYNIELAWPQIEWYLRRAAFYSRCVGRPLSPYVAAQAGDALSVFCPRLCGADLANLDDSPGAQLARAGEQSSSRAVRGRNLRNVLHAARGPMPDSWAVALSSGRTRSMPPPWGRAPARPRTGERSADGAALGSKPSGRARCSAGGRLARLRTRSLAIKKFQRRGFATRMTGFEDRNATAGTEGEGGVRAESKGSMSSVTRSI